MTMIHDTTLAVNRPSRRKVLECPDAVGMTPLLDRI